jgi:hypothetical protein
MTSEELFVMVVLVAMGSGVLIVVLGLRQRAHQLELAHRERMAMIDRGLVPSPESNPAHAAWAGQASPPQPSSRLEGGHNPGAASQRSMTLGIVIVAIGLGFMVLIGIAAQTPSVAVGVGGAITIVGLSFIVIALIKRSAPPIQSHHPPPLPMSRPNAGPDRPSADL